MRKFLFVLLTAMLILGPQALSYAGDSDAVVNKEAPGPEDQSNKNKDKKDKKPDQNLHRQKKGAGNAHTRKHKAHHKVNPDKTDDKKTNS